jgi:hypothetical protein
MTTRTIKVPRARAASTLAGLLAFVLAQGTHAAHPLQTEDTATQGTGTVELENALAWGRHGPRTDFSYQPQVSVGVTPAIDLIVQPSWLSTRTQGERPVRGFGDTNLDAKWRFADTHPWSLAVRSGFMLATNEQGLGIPDGRVGLHAMLAASWASDQLALHTSAGVARVPSDDPAERTTAAYLSSALVWRPVSRWALLAEAGVDSSPQRGSRTWPATMLIGAARNVRPGFDLDIGYRVSFDRGPNERTVLAGVTWHFKH